MPIKKAKSTSPGRRFVVQVISPELHKGEPHSPLLLPKKRISARNNQGRICMRYRGGGHKRQYRIIDFKRNKDEIPGRIERLEYDPNRSAHIALVLYADGERRYIIAAKGLAAGSKILSGNTAPIKPGNALTLSQIPLGTNVHCVELKPGKGAQLARSAGSYVQIISKEGMYCALRMRSGEVRKVLANCRATIGEVANAEHNLRSLGKAGAQRWRGRKPHVRGMAMNPVDHPHGGGEGRSFGNHNPPVSFSNVPAKGYKTRKNKRTKNMIVRNRKRK